jgi:polysaccharide export outer membrane protein
VTPSKRIGLTTATCFVAALSGCGSVAPAYTDAHQFAHRGAETSAFTEPGDSEDLARLWTSRTETPIDADYPVGAGDVLEINAQYVEELKNKTVRVAGDGGIDLPLVGVVQAAGLSEKKLAEEIAQKLSKYMYDPQVQVFVRKFHSHQVAVIGAVRTPGLVTLSDSSETVLDMITQSGGTTNDAGDEVILFPAGQSAKKNRGGLQEASLADGLYQQSPDDPFADAAANPRSGLSASARPGGLTGTNSQPIVIPLHSTSLTGAGRFLQLPVRPGDVMVVPGGGEVMVLGWVQTPGHFAVGSGLTVLGAIGAAGGPAYAANESDVQLIRSDRSGRKRIVRIDLEAIKNGEASDPPVAANDVINVPYSTVKIGPYVFYSLLKQIGMGVGFGGSIP